MYDALNRFINIFFDEDSESIIGTSYQNVRCINHIVNNIDAVLEKNSITEDIDIIENIAYSIQQYIRWSRKSFGGFLKSDEFALLNLTDEMISFWEKSFESWSVIGLVMYKVVYTSNYEKLVELRSKIVKLVFDEIKQIIELKGLLVGLNNYVDKNNRCIYI